MRPGSIPPPRQSIAPTGRPASGGIAMWTWIGSCVVPSVPGDRARGRRPLDSVPSTMYGVQRAELVQTLLRACHASVWGVEQARASLTEISGSIIDFDDLDHTEHAHEFVGAEHGEVPFSVIL